MNPHSQLFALGMLQQPVGDGLPPVPMEVQLGEPVPGGHTCPLGLQKLVAVHILQGPALQQQQHPAIAAHPDPPPQLPAENS
jgi:hypothetical protein